MTRWPWKSGLVFFIVLWHTNTFLITFYCIFVLVFFGRQTTNTFVITFLLYFCVALLLLWRYCFIIVVETTKSWYFVSKIVLTYCEKKMFKWLRKTFEIPSWRPRICKIFEITRTIYSNSERSEQFLVTECFSNFSCMFLNPNNFFQFPIIIVFIY